jgi:choline dehydrogenase-like flavoprotein
MSADADVIVVGSGASGVHAAYPLVEAGLNVVMLDVGYEDDVYDRLIPDADFAHIRRTDPQQHRYLLGDRFEGVPLGPIGGKPELTPPRQCALKRTDELLPTLSQDFLAVQSLALGGLGVLWGAVSFPFQDNELIRCGLPPDEVHRHYEIVASRVGVSGGKNDDLESLRGKLESLQPPPELDGNAGRILCRYERQRAAFHRAGMYLGHSFLAMLTQPLNDRRPTAYHDMDYWSNKGESVYRPVSTLRDLRKRGNFSYRRPWLVQRFAEVEDGRIRVDAASPEGGQPEVFHARRLILAAGAMNTTRIVLRSLDRYDQRVPFVSNPTTYITCVQYDGLGEELKQRCHSLAQLTLIYDPTGDRSHLVQGQFYSYRSMLLFRLLRGLPLPQRESLRIMRAIAPHLVVIVLQHEDGPCPNNYCVLRHGSDDQRDYLEIGYRLSREAQARQDQQEKVILRALHRLRCWPVKVIHTRQGTGAHYAGQLPVSRQDRPMTTESSGRLRGATGVYIADGAMFSYLPAKGLTLTLMANANRVGSHVLAEFSE